MIVWIATKEWEGGSCILGASSSELAAMKRCVDHDPHHPNYCIESMELDGEYCISVHGYSSHTLQGEYRNRMRAIAEAPSSGPSRPQGTSG